MKSLYADTNVLVSFLTGRNINQTKELEKVFQDAQNDKLRIVVIPEIIIEVYFVLQSNYSTSRGDIYQALKQLVSSPQLEVKNRSLLLESLEIFGKVNMSLLDIYLYLTAKHEKSEVFSFDKDLEKLKSRF
jgi:predicted nucleic-acid-binding protein